MALLNGGYFETKSLAVLQSSYPDELNSLDKSTKGFEREVKIIDKLQYVKAACDHLKQFKELAVDCEGVNLGRGGKLTLIQLMPHEDSVYIFDVLVLGKEVFENGLKQILESKEVVKYMFDCRGDSDSLYHEHNVKLTNVLDMQLFEFIVRPIAGTSLRGPSRRTHFQKPCIRGLNATINTYVSSNDLRKTGISSCEAVKSKGSNLMKQEWTVWRYRPVHLGLLKYAALDVVMIWLVKYALSKVISLQGITRERLEMASEIYAAMRRDHEKPDDLFIRHPIMACFVIPECIEDKIQSFPIGDSKCEGCRRWLTKSCMKSNKCGDCRDAERVDNAYKNAY